MLALEEVVVIEENIVTTDGGGGTLLRQKSVRWTLRIYIGLCSKYIVVGKVLMSVRNIL